MKALKEQLIGTIYSMGALSVAELINRSGFDWVMIDMEHSALSPEDVQNALPVFGTKILRIVRVPGNDEIWIKRILDTGCDGIMVPMVKTREEAERLVKSAKYPPDGQRSVGLARAHGYGKHFDEYVAHANRELIIMAQIEHIDGVRNLDSILGVSGIDAIFIGPYDLSASMGLTGQVKHPEVVQAIRQIRTKCRDAGMPYGIFGSNAEALKQEVRDGCNFVLCGVDISLLSNLLKDLSDKLHAML
jgi:2-dehydro-3-deoxyglucarate aldolase/4-hydroxy-2-oxoheptanedioate aldolase